MYFRPVVLDLIVVFLSLTRALFMFGLAGLQLARVFFFYEILGRFHLALLLFIRALFTFGLVALHLARVFLNFGPVIVYFRLGWLTLKSCG